MKRKFNILPYFALIALLVACTGPEVEVSGIDESGRKVCPMTFNCDVNGFDNALLKAPARANTSSETWEEGDQVYISFYDGNTIIPGEATYSATNGWQVSYDGFLPNGTGLKCAVHYFENAIASNISVVKIGHQTAIYEALDGQYAYDGTAITVAATLTPKTGRIRFKGTHNTLIRFTGITHYASFSPAVNTFSTNTGLLSTTVGTDGFTPYIYGYYSNEENTIAMKGPDFAFTRDFPANSLDVGASGYAAIPTESSHNDWRKGLYIKVNGVECRMLPVKGYTNGFFLLGETEVTEEFYYAVMGGTTSSSQLPMSNINYAQATSFASQLTQLTYWNFGLPTREEWQFAAKGGNDSQGYNYAGSNDPDAVAWYAANSNGKKHNVKSKAPNELGFFDMSGNMEEWTSSSYSGSYKYCCGGSYNTAATGIYVTSNSTVSTTYNYDYLGFRLVCK